ncbi:MAG: hypothetical protein JWM80_6730 [Cyanobacteria bacterium RYN_339]|nr:hypothetical protein [Cyanobacteria bacterium RYN_339]
MTEATEKLSTGITLRDMVTKTIQASPVVEPPPPSLRLRFVAPKPMVGPPPPPPSAAADSFVGTWQQRVVHYLGKDEEKSVAQELKTAVMRGVVHL